MASSVDHYPLIKTTRVASLLSVKKLYSGSLIEPEKVRIILYAILKFRISKFRSKIQMKILYFNITSASRFYANLTYFRSFMHFKRNRFWHTTSEIINNTIKLLTSILLNLLRLDKKVIILLQPSNLRAKLSNLKFKGFRKSHSVHY